MGNDFPCSLQSHRGPRSPQCKVIRLPLSNTLKGPTSLTGAKKTRGGGWGWRRETLTETEETAPSFAGNGSGKDACKSSFTRQNIRQMYTRALQPPAAEHPGPAPGRRREKDRSAPALPPHRRRRAGQTSPCPRPTEEREAACPSRPLRSAPVGAAPPEAHRGREAGGV